VSILSSVTFALKRLWSHPGLALCLAVGLVTAVALAVAVPLYADGINYHQLSTVLSQTADQSRRSPFTFIFHYVGAWHEPIELEEYQPVDTFMAEQIAGMIGLPISDNSGGIIRYVSTDNLPLYPQGDRIDRTQRLDLVKLAFVSSIFEHVQLVDGQLPSEDYLPGQEVPGVEVLVPLKMANQLGLNVGDVYLFYKANELELEPFRLQVRVSGIWQPTDAQDEFWFYSPESFDNRMLVAESVFFTDATENLPQPINEAVWRITFDGRDINSEDVPSLLARVAQAQTRVNSLLPNTDLEASPLQALRQYRQDSLALTSLLFVFSAPVLGLVFYFLGLVTAMLVRRQRNEIAILRSRGASRGWVVMIYALEWSLLGLIVLLAGPWIGVAMANLFGQTQSFLDFTRLSEWPVRLTARTAGFGIVVIAFAVFFSIIPVWQAGRFTIVSFKLERARANQRPLWQRAYLDVLVILPAAYGLYILRDHDSGGWLGGGDPFENPLLFMLPTFFILGSSLLLLRVLPIVLSGLDWLISHLPGTVPILVFRQLSRSAGTHMAPLMLMVVTLSLAGFVASMAHTLDSSMSDHVYYQVGADLNLVEGGEYTGEAPPQPVGPGFPGNSNTVQ
jgi:putative ABC transport system permease protein